MAAKRKKAAKPAKASGICTCFEDPSTCKVYSLIEAWILILLGILGLLETLGIMSFGQIPFGYIWSILVLVIGIKKVMEATSLP